MNTRFPKLDATRPFGADLVVRKRRQQARRRSPYAPAIEAAVGALFYGIFVAVLLRVASLATY